MKIMRILLMGLVISIFVVGQAYSAPKGNNGKNNGKAQNGNAQNGNAQNGNAQNGNAQAAKTNQKGGKSTSVNKGKSAESKRQARRSSENNRRREERNRSSDRNPSLNNGKSDLAFNKRSERANNGKRNGEEMRNEKAQRAFDLIDSLNRARWSHNPHDTRGQGNMGKVDMLDPYGHDKDSDRKELYGNNGRPIKESSDGENSDNLPVENQYPIIEEELSITEDPIEEEPIITEDPIIVEELLNLADLLSVDFTINDSLILAFQQLIERYQSLAQQYPEQTSYAATAAHYEQYLESYIATKTVDYLAFNLDHTIDYSLTFDSSAGFEGTTLLVTTSLLAAEDTDLVDTRYVFDPTTGTYILFNEDVTHYDAGQVVTEQTQEVTLSSDGSLSFSYDVPDDMTSGVSLDFTGIYTELLVTVTDPESGSTFTTTYDRQINLYRCPYGNVTDSSTGQPVVGAKITVHFEDGSIVALDKATNKTASNPQITDATGRFGFILQTNRKYYLTAQAEGYEEYKSPVFTEQWHVLREDIEMEPKLEQVVSNVE